MTNITIQDLVEKEIIHCVSELIRHLTSIEKGVEEKQRYRLLQGSIDYDLAEKEMAADYEVFEEDGRFGVRKCRRPVEIIVKPCHNDKKNAIEAWCESSENDANYYARKVREDWFREHWIVSTWLAQKLAAYGETVVSVHGMTVWCRGTTDQVISKDWVIEKIYQDLISK